MVGDDFAVTVGWGHFESSNSAMFSQGRTTRRKFTYEA